jgi:hypothetical protein
MYTTAVETAVTSLAPFFRTEFERENLFIPIKNQGFLLVAGPSFFSSSKVGHPMQLDEGHRVYQWLVTLYSTTFGSPEIK